MSLDLFQRRIRILQEDLAQVIAEGLNAGHSAAELFDLSPQTFENPRPVRRKRSQDFDL